MISTQKSEDQIQFALQERKLSRLFLVTCGVGAVCPGTAREAFLAALRTQRLVSPMRGEFPIPCTSEIFQVFGKLLGFLPAASASTLTERRLSRGSLRND